MLQRNNQNKKDIKSILLDVFIGKNVLFVIAAILIIIGMIISNNFLSYTNLLNVARAISLLGIVAVGVFFITYSGNFIDMSIPNIIAVSGIVAIEGLRFGIVPGLLLGIIAGVIIGCINGLVVGRLKANPIIWTIAMSFTVDGAIRWIYQGRQIYPDSDGILVDTSNVFTKLSRADLFRVPPMVIFLIFLAIIFSLIIFKTKFGAQLKLVGSSPEVAKMTGVNVKRIILMAFALSALASSIAGIFMASIVKTGVYSNGKGYDMDALAIVVIGGISLSGGEGNIIGVIGGAVVIGLLNNILTLLGVDTISQNIFKGLIFIIIIGLKSYYAKKRLGDVTL